MMKRKLILIAFISTICTQAYSQIDEQFSMYSETKIQINPAAAGFFKAKYKFFTNYRQQWWGIRDQVATTFSASFDTRVKDLEDGSFIGGGLYFANDLSGDLRFNQLNIAIPINYAIRVDEYSRVSFGLAPGFFQRGIADNTPTWDNQWSDREGMFVQTNPSGEQIFNSQEIVGRFDLAAGLYWEFNYNEYVYMSLGLSGSHLTRPKINLLPDDNRMFRTMNLHYFGNFGKEDFPLTFRPSVMWAAQGAYLGTQQLLVFGSTIDILLRGESKMTGYYNRTSLELGGHFRYNDAVIGSLALHTGGMSFGVSYDFIVSGLSNIIGPQGATEFFLYYRMGKPKGKGQIELVYPD